MRENPRQSRLRSRRSGGPRRRPGRKRGAPLRLWPAGHGSVAPPRELARWVRWSDGRPGGLRERPLGAGLASGRLWP
eukprot:5002625-Alexandrium_andersonii.AAC.1